MTLTDQTGWKTTLLESGVVRVTVGARTVIVSHYAGEGVTARVKVDTGTAVGIAAVNRVVPMIESLIR
jgi:hypothetical protein